MEEKFQDILNEYDIQISRYEKEIDNLESKEQFCIDHNFEEERRIIRIKLDKMNMVIYRWRKMHQELQELLNKWLS